MQLNKNSKIFLAGHSGMVGSSILRYFKKKGYKKIITQSRKKLNLLNQKSTYRFLKKIKPNFGYMQLDPKKINFLTPTR